MDKRNDVAGRFRREAPGIGDTEGRQAAGAQALERYLTMISADTSGFLEVRWRRRSGGMRQRFAPTTVHGSLVDPIMRLGQGTDVYVGCAPRAFPRGTGDAVKHVSVLWVDVDTPPAVAMLAMFDPPPTMVVLSGGITEGYAHRHAYWALLAPVSAADAVRFNRRLAYALDGDMRSTDAARILRPPATLNHKSDPPTPVECLRFRHTSYEAGAVAGHLPDPARDTRVSQIKPIQPASDDPLRRIPATEYVPALTGREIGRDGKIACPFHHDRTPSLHVYPDDGGWVCFGCGRGGTIIDFGSALYDVEPRGTAYHDIRRRLASDLLATVREARRA